MCPAAALVPESPDSAAGGAGAAGKQASEEDAFDMERRSRDDEAISVIAELGSSTITADNLYFLDTGS